MRPVDRRRLDRANPAGRPGQPHSASHCRARAPTLGSAHVLCRAGSSWPTGYGGRPPPVEAHPFSSSAVAHSPRAQARASPLVPVRRQHFRGQHSPGTQKSWRRPIFPKGCPLSIFGAGELNDRVRYGNGCGLSARVTRISCVEYGSAAARATGEPVARRRQEETSITRMFKFGQRTFARPIPVQPPTPGQLLKRSSPRPLVRLSFAPHGTSTCRLSNRWSTCGLTRLTRWGTSSRGELRT